MAPVKRTTKSATKTVNGKMSEAVPLGIGGFLISNPVQPVEALSEGAVTWNPPPSFPVACKASKVQLCNEFIEFVNIVPWGVLGSRQVSSSPSAGRTGVEMLQTAAAPSSTTAIVDAADFQQFHRKGPHDAIGSARYIYQWLGISRLGSFPEDVKKAIRMALDAKYCVYDTCKVLDAKTRVQSTANVIHVASPSLEDATYSSNRRAVVRDLAKAYSNCLRAFAYSALPSLRLPPLGMEASSCAWLKEMPEITRQALCEGFKSLESATQRYILESTIVELCIFNEDDYERFLMAFDPGSESDSSDAETWSGSHSSPLSHWSGNLSAVSNSCGL